MLKFAEMRAFSVHIFTAAGAAFAFGALIAAVRAEWSVMFLCFGAALVIDGVDGTFARRLRVVEVLPRWSGETLDLVIDFVTYVFIPAYAITSSGLLPDVLSVPAGVVIVMTSALYFADRNMKTDDYYFRGFPALWNVAAFYLFLLKPAPWLAAGMVALLAVLTFVPFKFIHPFRVKRLRAVSFAAVVAWTVLALIAVLRHFAPGPWIVAGLVAIGLYFLGIGLTDRSDKHA